LIRVSFNNAPLEEVKDVSGFLKEKLELGNSMEKEARLLLKSMEEWRKNFGANASILS